MGVRPAPTALAGPPVAVHRYRRAIHLRPVAAPVTAAIVLTSSRRFLDAATARSMTGWFARHGGVVCAAWRSGLCGMAERFVRHGGAVCAAWKGVYGHGKPLRAA